MVHFLSEKSLHAEQGGEKKERSEARGIGWGRSFYGIRK